MPNSKAPILSRYEVFVVALLGFLQFSIILDFMILSPMGAMIMPALHLTPSEFGLIVSAYAFSAGLSGVLAAGFADRFDRKRMLLFFYSGFIVGTLLCGLAPSYQLLLGARVVTGLFGGVIGSIVLAITTDLFAMAVRGRVMGVIQTAFAASQVLGIPIGLYLSNNLGWQAPFFMIVGISVLVAAIIVVYLRPINAHLKLQKDADAFHHLLGTMRQRRHLQAFAATAFLSTGGFMLMPFSSAFSVRNLGVALTDLPFVYMVTGCVAFISGPIMGRISDWIGKYRVFLLGSVITIVMVLIYTNLGKTPLPMVMLVNSMLFIGITGRIVASQALISAVPQPANRGAFMAVNSSMQQISGGIASVLAGLIVDDTGTELRNFDRVGLVVTGATLLTLFLMYKIHLRIPEPKPKILNQAA